MGCDADYLREKGYFSLLQGDAPDDWSYPSDGHEGKNARKKENLRFCSFREAKAWAKRNRGKSFVRNPNGQGFIAKKNLTEELEKAERERESAKRLWIYDRRFAYNHINYSEIEYLEISWSELSWSKDLELLAAFIGKLVNLKELSISDWTGENLPREILNASSLRKVKIAAREIIAKFPEELLLLRQVEHISLISGVEYSRFANFKNNGPSFFDKKADYLKYENPDLYEGCTNYFRGLCNLTRLKHLTIENCTDIPEEIIQLTNLCSLNISSCASVHPNIGKLDNIKTLIINGNYVSYPSEIFQLKQLEHLELHSIEKIPADIGNLVNLKTLDLSFCKDEELPAEIGKLVNLDTLILSKSKLVRLPPEIGQLKSLCVLVLNSCDLIDELPEGIYSLENLTQLHIEFAHSLCVNWDLYHEKMPSIEIVTNDSYFYS